MIMKIGRRFSDFIQFMRVTSFWIKSINQGKMKNSLKKDKNPVNLIGWKDCVR